MLFLRLYFNCNICPSLSSLQAFPFTPPYSFSNSWSLFKSIANAYIICKYTHIYSHTYYLYNLLRSYNVTCMCICMYVLEAGSGEGYLSCSQLSSLPIVLCIGLRPLVLFPHVLFNVCWCPPCSCHIRVVMLIRLYEYSC